MGQVTLFSGGSVVEPSQAVDALRGLAMAKAMSGGKPFLKLEKQSGKFVYGAESVEVSPDELWAIDPSSFMIGKIGWKGGQVVGEKMFPITSGAMINEADLTPIDSNNPSDGWKDQLSVDLKHLADGVEVVFKTTALGGKNAIADLAGAIGEHTAQNPALPVAVVKMYADSYSHKQYGKIYTPVFEIVDWVDVHGQKPKPSKPAKPKPKPLV